MDNPIIIKDQVFQFFSDKVQIADAIETFFCLPEFEVILDNDAASLIQPFSLLKIKDMVWSCDGDKAPSPDGFNFKFIKWFWSCFKADFVSLFDDFFLNGVINPAFHRFDPEDKRSPGFR